MTQQTALQSFWDKIALKLSVQQVNEFLPELQKALEMEKKQIEDAYWDGGQDIPTSLKTCKWYYNETFNTKEK
jgi:hypothetical protein